MKLTDNADQLFNYGDKVSLKMIGYGSGFGLSARCSSPGRPLSYLHRPEDFLPPEQIEGHLPEENINGILSNPGKAGTRGIVVQVV